MWKHYFGKGARIIGVDLAPDTYFEESQIEVKIFDQGDKKKLETLPAADIVIDDGGHRFMNQKPTFDVLYPKTSGVYLIEDTHTAYMPGYHNNQETIIDHAKQNIDRLHSWHTGKPDAFAWITKSIHFYDSIVVYEKGEVEKPQSVII